VALSVLTAGCTFHAEGRVSANTTTSAAAADPTPAPAPAQQESTVQASNTQKGSGVQVVEVSCQPDGEEQCNGLDDNCNGEIDEGCGYSSGSIQVTLSWETKADLDLYVTDPAGETLSHQNTEVASGGYLDHDARGKCRPDEQKNTIENVYWEKGTSPPSGKYEVKVHYYAECASGAGPTTATVSISVGGKIIGSYNYQLSPTQESTIATFTIP
jgi:tRNA (guanosine-2'-O-)-methyltransferase